MLSIKEELFHAGRRESLIMRATGPMDLETLLGEYADDISEKLLDHGAILLRGFGISDVARFESVVAAMPGRGLDYIYRSTPRTSVGTKIFTATEFPPALEIPLHNENAYQRDWPLKIAFCCIDAATTGGQTPIADMRAVTQALGSDLLNEFESRQIKYIRHYRPYADLSWQTVFQTQDRDEVTRYCEANDIASVWLDKQTLRTTQTCQGVARHPVTGERLLFNQAHLFHVSSLGAEAAKALIVGFGIDRLPRHACFGDDGELDVELLQKIRDAMNAAAIEVVWQPGDVLLLDNMQVAHGRRPFTGKRQLLAALLDSHAEFVQAQEQAKVPA